MKNILMVFLIIFALLFCNSNVFASENDNSKTVVAVVLKDSIEDTKDLVRTGIKITFWLFPVIVGIAIIKNINVGKGKKGD